MVKFEKLKKKPKVKKRTIPVRDDPTAKMFWRIREKNRKGKPEEALVLLKSFLGFNPVKKSIETIAFKLETFSEEETKENILLEVCEALRQIEDWERLYEFAWKTYFHYNCHSHQAVYYFIISAYNIGAKDYLERALTVAQSYLESAPLDFTIGLWKGHLHIKRGEWLKAAKVYAIAESNIEKEYGNFIPRGNIWKTQIDAIFNPLDKISMKERIEQKLFWIFDKLKEECANRTTGQIIDKEKYEDALSVTQEIEEYSSLELGILKRGELYSLTNQYDKAEQALEYAVDMNPKYFEAFAGLALIFLEQGDYKRALIHIDKAIYYDKNKKNTDHYNQIRNDIMEHAVMNSDIET